MNELTARQSGRGVLSRSTAASVLLVCGILSSLLYVATDFLAAARWDGYRIADRAVSELLAVGSPTRAFVVPPMIAYNLLIVAFGVGILLSAGPKRALRVTGILMIAYGFVSQLGLTVFPLQPDSALSATGEMPLSGVLHSAETIALVLMMFLFIGFGAAGLGKGFRLYSIATILLVLAGGVLAGSLVQRIAAGIPTPWFGVLERTNIYSTLLWIGVFAVALLRANSEQASLGRAGAQEADRKKKVVVLMGSPQKRGATYTAARKFLENLEAFGDVQGEIVALSDYEIGVCRGCKVCFEHGEDRCPLEDDRDVVFEKMLSADAVVFATPNYSWMVSGVMKVFLDRLGFMFHRPRFHGKTATSIVVQGMFRGQRIARDLEFVAGGLGFNVVKGCAIRTLKPMTEEALRKMDKQLAEHARRFHDRLLRPAQPVPSLLQLAMFRMSRSGINKSVPEDKADHIYWGGRGWFESEYYYPTRLGPFKRAAGALFDWIAVNTSAFAVAEEPETAVGSTSSRPAPQ